MRSKRYSTSSSSSEDEALIVLKQAKEFNGYHSLRKKSLEQCEFCDEEFSDRYSLFQHNITHMIVPVVKLNLYQCRECLRHFESNEDLDSHMLKYHNKLIIKPNISNNSNNVKEKVPDILKSIVEKQLVVKCDDDINLFVSTKLNKNGKKEKSDNRNPISESKKDNMTSRATKNDSNIYNSSQSIGEVVNKDVKIINDNAKHKKDSKIYNDGIKSTENGDTVKRAPNIIIVEMSPPPVEKVEPFSPPVKERASSPLDDDKESIRHRLLFEEDIEDTLFRDISNECHVNIDTLCQELDLDEALVVSDSDDTMSLGLNIKTSDNKVINNSENQMNIHDIEENNFEIIADYSGGNLINGTGFEHDTNMTNGINNFGYGMNNCESAVDNFENQMSVFKVFRSHGINLEALNIIEDGNNGVQEKIEVEFGNSIHYEVLTSPDVCYCKYCGRQFFNRFELLQHEPTHIQIKKPHFSTPLCCLCDRYIAGNHYSLKKHITNQHPEHGNEETYKTKYCPKCGLKYHNYSKHLKNHHEAYKCDNCLARFETFQQKNTHICGENTNIMANSFNSTFNRKSDVSMDTFAVMQLCDLCFSFMKIYMQNRQNYEEIGTKTELGVRQTCDKCNKEFFSVNLVKRKSLRHVIDKEGRMTENQKSDVCQMALDGLKAVEFGQKAADFGQKTAGFGQKVDKKVDFKAKMRTKALSNKERLVKIQQRLKMMKMINKR